MAQVVTNALLEIESTRGTAITVSDVTNADPGVATATSHGLSTDDVVFFTVTAGMVELHRQAVKVTNLTTDTFELTNVNTTDYSTWSAGTATEITAWETLCNVTNVSLGNAAPTEVDLSAYCDKVSQTGFGLPGSASGTIDMFDQPGLAALKTLQDAGSNDYLVFRATYATDNIKVFGALTAYGGGFDAPINGAITQSAPLTVVNQIIHYSS